MDREELLFQARLGEARALFTAEYANFERTDRVLGFGITVVTGGAAVGIANGFEEVILAVPTALALLFAYTFQLYADAFALGAARRGLRRYWRSSCESRPLSTSRRSLL